LAARSTRSSSALQLNAGPCCRGHPRRVGVQPAATEAVSFHEGPVFTNILLADEINRASRARSSACSEAMGEAAGTWRDERRGTFLNCFFVIATQNPVEFRGTYPLPEAQMDRFAMQFTLGYVTHRGRGGHSDGAATQPSARRIETRRDAGDVLALKRAVEDVRISDELKRYAWTWSPPRALQATCNWAPARAPRLP